MDITLVPGFNPGPYTGAGNNTYVLRGRIPTVIDAATGDPRHLDALARALDGASLARVLVTHGHTDHARGCPAIAARWPDAEFAKIHASYEAARALAREWGRVSSEAFLAARRG